MASTQEGHEYRAPLRLAVAQLDARPGERAENTAAVVAAATAAQADVLVTPELVLTGYDVRDAAISLSVPLITGQDIPEPYSELSRAPGAVLAGLLERGRDEVPYNSAVLLEGGRVRYVHRKLYLPTYGMFDEARWFGRGQRLEPCELPNGWRAGVLICEDFWHPGLIYVLAAAGIDVLLVLSAGPGRGVWAGSAHGDFASWDAWEGIARTTASLYGMYVALANRSGVEGGVTFAGGSLIVDPQGDVISRASSHGSETLLATLEPGVLARSRRPSYHGRDDDPRVIVRELQRLGLA